MKTRNSLTVAAGMMAVLFIAVPVRAQEAGAERVKNVLREAKGSPDRSATLDPAQLAPDIYKVLLDNDHVRVLEVHLPAGQKSTMHAHPGYIIYCITPGKIRFTSPDGKSNDVEFSAGQTMWRDAESHEPLNIGDSECHVLNIELKGVKEAGQAVAEMAKWKDAAAGEHADHQMVALSESKWQAAPPGLPAGSQVAVLEGDPSKSGPFTMRAKLPAGYKIPPHFHPADEHVTVISGALYMGGGDRLDEGKSKELAAGGFALMPAGFRHYAWTKNGTVLQLHGIGPWGITYVNPSDDPRGKAGEMNH